MSLRDAGHASALPVLVIDDDAGLRDLYTRALGRAGFETIVASDGSQGLEIVATTAVGLVVCDLSMPRLDGFAVVRMLRANPDTATLPVIIVTGTGDADSVVEGLEAGADDFLSKPVRVQELIARVRAHIRTEVAWAAVVDTELRGRVAVVAALGQLGRSADPETAATTVTRELAQRAGVAFVAVFQITAPGRGRMLASTLPSDARGRAAAPNARRVRLLVERAGSGPWTEDVGGPEPDEPLDAFWPSELSLVAGAPVYSMDRLVGVLVLGVVGDTGRSPSPRTRDHLLAAAIDYAGILGAAIGSALVARGDTQTELRRLRRILRAKSFETAFQPIVDLETRLVVGYEALTRFSDGVPPDVRFAEATAVGIGTEFEIAAIAGALAAATAGGIPAGVFLSVNISPHVAVEAADRLRAVLAGATMPIVLELTEHVRIDNYGNLLAAVKVIGDVRVAIDDAGAGFASMRHILELAPAFAKLDISLVRGIDSDPLRQSLAAGLAYYAARSGFQLIAEGIEEAAEANALEALGVDLGQGYLFGRPGRLGP